MFTQFKNRLTLKGDQQGFSLIELMVSLSVFAIVMTISVGTILIMIDVNAKAQALFSSTTNVSFALDNITREIRTGHHYHCSISTEQSSIFEANASADHFNLDETSNCTSGNTILFTREKDNERSGYALRVNDDTGVGTIHQFNSVNKWIPITSDDVDIDTFELVVSNTEPYYGGSSNTDQPVVNLLIMGKLLNGLDVSTDFSVQTHVVQRRLDII